MSRPIDLDLIGDIEIEGIDYRDAHDFCDAFISSAYWTDTGIELTDCELNELNETEPQFVYDEVIKRIY